VSVVRRWPFGPCSAIHGRELRNRAIDDPCARPGEADEVPEPAPDGDDGPRDRDRAEAMPASGGVQTWPVAFGAETGAEGSEGSFGSGGTGTDGTARGRVGVETGAAGRTPAKATPAPAPPTSTAARTAAGLIVLPTSTFV